jgi:hypothetical protein
LGLATRLEALFAEITELVIAEAEKGVPAAVDFEKPGPRRCPWTVRRRYCGLFEEDFIQAPIAKVAARQADIAEAVLVESVENAPRTPPPEGVDGRRARRKASVHDRNDVRIIARQPGIGVAAVRAAGIVLH